MGGTGGFSCREAVAGTAVQEEQAAGQGCGRRRGGGRGKGPEPGTGATAATERLGRGRGGKGGGSLRFIGAKQTCRPDRSRVLVPEYGLFGRLRGYGRQPAVIPVAKTESGPPLARAAEEEEIPGRLPCAAPGLHSLPRLVRGHALPRS